MGLIFNSNSEENQEQEMEKLILEYHRRFANGEQYIELTSRGIEEIGKDYWWQERLVFNYIAPLLQTTSLGEVEKYGKNGLVAKLIPYQILYNKLKNKKFEFLINPKILVVEDGSVDVDNLENEGLAPGKILVYRNGATPPSTINLEPSEKFLNTINLEEGAILEEMRKITETYCKICECKNKFYH